MEKLTRWARNEEGATGKTEAWQPPYLTAFGGFEHIYTVPDCQNSYMKSDLSCCSFIPATETFCLKPQIYSY